MHLCRLGEREMRVSVRKMEGGMKSGCAVENIIEWRAESRL